VPSDAIATKKTIALRMSATYATLMDADTRLYQCCNTYVWRRGIWRIDNGKPILASTLMCDIRRGRTAERRMTVPLLKKERPPAPNIERYAIHKMFDDCSSAACFKGASPRDSLGIVRK
jgi:hypothetical protein